MDLLARNFKQLTDDGFTVVEDVFTVGEIDGIVSLIDKADQSNPTFRKTEDLFAIRRFLAEVPEVKGLILNEKLKTIINDLFGDQYFIVKSIYFDKPEKSNWFVAWHQDLTIATSKKAELPGYNMWTVKFNQFAVQPPVEILENNFTIRIHLDDTDEGNGALKVLKKSHSKGVRRAELLDWSSEEEHSCNVGAGGVMIMRPLLFHASDRTTTNKTRRVIHIEFSAAELPGDVNWAEQMPV
jgi:ectoine hydroxylase-related dioxygenase (phytanoyl-CoA dioxygenase family)